MTQENSDLVSVYDNAEGYSYTNDIHYEGLIRPADKG
jgi:hypothetical protein